MGKNGDNSNGYDLNSGARGDYIYMHFTTECMTAQAIWCSGSKTLYFTNCLKHHVTGDTYNGQTVTKAWYEDDIIHMTSSPEWVKETGVKENVTTVKFEKSFKIVRPTNLSMWFFNFSQLTNIVGIENLNTSEVTSMAGMFWGCTALTSIDVNSFDMRSVKNISYMFQYCPKLTTIYCNESWSDISDGAAMFKDCTALKGAVAYDDNKTDNQMANPRTGYFLKKGKVFIAETTNPVSVTLNNATPYTHEAVNFTIIPEKDYYIEFLTVNGNTSRQKYPLTDNGDNSYTFTMPGEDVTINFICNPLLSFFTDVLIVTQDDDNLKSYKDKGWSRT